MNALINNAFNPGFLQNSSFDPDTLVPSPVQYPVYHVSRASIVPGIDDKALSLLAPLLSYWTLSLLFHLLDSDVFQWPAKYRIHPSEEVKSRNLATRKDVVVAVIWQQVLQTVLGIVWLDDSESDSLRNHAGEMRELGLWVARLVVAILGENKGTQILVNKGRDLVSLLYWWGIPAVQYIWAIFFLDTWQYFLHRLFHVNRWLYKYIHAVHHRLYVPYAFGALYNHPLEGFLFDTLGAAIAQAVSSMTLRQATFLFVLSTLKTVDDHCGYALPWDPLQAIFGNNAAYHDIHHQVIGIKSNFSQPYFIHWDVLLGTRLTRGEMEARRRKTKDLPAKTE